MKHISDTASSSDKADIQRLSQPRNNKLFSQSPEILLVEDDEITRIVISRMLTSLNCCVEVAKTGKQALEMYSSHKYDLIFLDINLPDITGLGVCMAIRNQEHQKHTPIIAITGFENKREICLSVGVDEFIIKPLNRYKCQRILARWLGFPKEKNLKGDIL